MQIGCKESTHDGKCYASFRLAGNYSTRSRSSTARSYSGGHSSFCLHCRRPGRARGDDGLTRIYKSGVSYGRLSSGGSPHAQTADLILEWPSLESSCGRNSSAMYHLGFRGRQDEHGEMNPRTQRSHKGTPVKRFGFLRQSRIWGLTCRFCDRFTWPCQMPYSHRHRAVIWQSFCRSHDLHHSPESSWTCFSDLPSSPWALVYEGSGLCGVSTLGIAPAPVPAYTHSASSNFKCPFDACCCSPPSLVYLSPMIPIQLSCCGETRGQQEDRHPLVLVALGRDGQAQNIRIGCSGAEADHVASDDGVVFGHWSQWILRLLFEQGFAVVLHLRLAVLFVLARLWLYSLMRGRCRVRSCLAKTKVIVPDRILLALTGFSPASEGQHAFASGPAARASIRHQGRGKSCFASLPRGLLAVLSCLPSCLSPIVFGCCNIPVCVWAAPAGLPQALCTLEHVTSCLPEPIRHSSYDAFPAHRYASNTPSCDDATSARTQHCVLYQAGFPAYYFLTYIEIPCTRDAFLDAASEMSNPDVSNTFVCETRPQLINGVASLVRVPCWTAASDQTVYVLDFTYWGGPIFAVLDWRFTNRNSLAHFARIHACEPWDVFHPSRSEPLGHEAHVIASAGDVFQFRPAGANIATLPTFAERLQCKSLWNNEPRFIPREAPSSKWFAMSSHVTRTPHYAGGSSREAQSIIAEALHSRVDELYFVYPRTNSSLQDLVYEGFLMRNILAVTPANSTGKRFGSLVFVDPRQLGLRPFFLQVENGCVRPRQIVEHLGFSCPQGYKLCIQGKGDNDLPVVVADEDTIVLYLENATEDDGDVPVPADMSAPPNTSKNRSSPSNRDVPNPPAQPTVFARDDPPSPDPEEILEVVTHDEDDAAAVVHTRVGFLVFAPRYQPEAVQVYLQLPCDVDTALQEVDAGRQSDATLYFDKLLPAVPQPTATFASIIAAPSWAQHLAVVLIDAWAVDGRIFALEIKGKLNKASLLLHIGLDPSSNLEVLIHGRVMDQQGWQSFLTGDTVKVMPVGTPLETPRALEDMLNGNSDWSHPIPEFNGPHPLAFLVLTDGGHKVVPVDPDVIRSSSDFKHEVSRLFGYTEDKVTTCPAIPRPEDIAILGQKCKSVLVATEAVSKIPIPPGRYQPKNNTSYCLMQDRHLGGFPGS